MIDQYNVMTTIPVGFSTLQSNDLPLHFVSTALILTNNLTA